MDEGDIDNVFWLPDGRNVVVQGYNYPNDIEQRLVHVVPLNGEPWRDLFSRVKADDFGSMTIAPDGRTLLITAFRNHGSQLVEIDLTEALKNVKLP